MGFISLSHSHQHDPQLEEIIVLRILHLHDPPGIQAAPHFLPLGLDLLVGSHHCKWDAGLEKRRYVRLSQAEGKIHNFNTTKKRQREKVFTGYKDVFHW